MVFFLFKPLLVLRCVFRGEVKGGTVFLGSAELRGSPVPPGSWNFSQLINRTVRGVHGSSSNSCGSDSNGSK